MADTNLLAHVTRTFPDHEPIRTYEVAMPLWRFQVSLKVLERQRLPISARFMLRAIELGVNTTRLLGHYLGLDDDEVMQIGSGLLHADLVYYGRIVSPDTSERILELTSRGRHLVQEDQSISVPKRADAILNLNPLTRELAFRGKKGPDTLNPGEMRSTGLFVIPSRSSEPDFDQVSLDAVRDALRDAPFFRDREIVSLISVGKPVMEYRRGIRVYVLRRRESNRLLFAAYYQYRHLPVASDALSQLHANGESVIPDDADELYPELDIPDGFVPRDGAEVIRTYVESQQRSRELSLRHEQATSATVDTAEIPPHLQLELDRLQQLIEQITAERDSLRRQLEEQFAIQILDADDHRPHLENVFREAESEVIVVSPWLKPGAVNKYLCRLIAEATSRGVNVKLGYGFGLQEDPRNREHKRNRGHNIDAARTVRRMLQDAGAFNNNQLELVQLPETHEKVLIWDRTAAVVSSFNWLSYGGGDENHFRRETGFLTRETRTVASLRAKILETFKQGKKAVLAAHRDGLQAEDRVSTP